MPEPGDSARHAPDEDLRRGAEHRLGGDGGASAPATPEQAALLLHELRVHQIELEMQNEELRRAQEDLAESRGTYVDLFDLAPVGYLTLGDKNVVRSANLTAARLLGVERAALIGVPFTRFIMPADQDVFYRRRRLLDASGESQHWELRLLRQATPAAGDESFWVRCAGRPQATDEGETVVWLTFSDISERHEALAALADSEARWRAIVEGASEGINVLDLRSGRYTFMSPAQVAMTGLSADERNDLTAQDALERVHPDDRDLSVEQQRRLAAGEEGFEAVEYRWRVQSGEYRWFRDSRRLLRDAEGRPYALVGVCTDITEPKRLEESLRASEEMRAISEEVAHVGSFSWDVATGHTTWSPEMSRLFDYPSDEFSGDSTPVIETRVHPQDRALVMAATARAAEMGEPVPVEFRVVWRDGSEHVLRSAATAIRDASGTTVSLIGYYQDVTEARRAEKEIRRFNEELEQRVAQRTSQLEASNKELESFVYSASHDLRAPLRAIDGFSQMVAEDAASRLDAADQEHLQRVRAAAQRMADLIDQLLRLSRITGAELVCSEVDFSALATSVSEELTAGYPGRALDITVQPQVIAYADPTLLRLILTNLLDNACKFTAARESAHIQVGVADVDGDRAYYVRDDGVGFDEHSAPHLFGVFQRFHTREQFPGDGIGLATVQRLVAKHGGRVWAEAEVEKGATFYFTVSTAPAAV